MLNFKSFFEAAYDNSSGANFWGNYGAGVLPIAKESGRILLNHRSAYVNEPNTWGVWGGKVDKDEENELDFSAVARREFCEEAGYCSTIRLIPGYVFRTKGFEYHNFLGIIPREFEPNIPSEHRWETQGWKWVAIDEINQVQPLHFGLKTLLERAKTVRIFEKVNSKRGINHAESRRGTSREVRGIVGGRSDAGHASRPE